MSINKIEIQDGSGNVYYPKTSIDSVIYSDNTSIEEKIRILEYRLNELKGQLANSINNKTGSSLTSNSTVDEMTVAINSIKTLEQATADANATAGNILVDKTAYVNGAKITGTMPNKGAVTANLNCGGSYTIPAGYHNGSGKVTANSLSSQTGANATASNILVDKTAYVNGTKVTGIMPNKGAVTASLNCGGSYTIPEGYHNGSGKVTANSLASQTSANATAGDIISGKTAWVNGNKITGTATLQSLGGLIKKTFDVSYTKGNTIHISSNFTPKIILIENYKYLDHRIYIYVDFSSYISGADIEYVTNTALTELALKNVISNVSSTGFDLTLPNSETSISGATVYNIRGIMIG